MSLVNITDFDQALTLLGLYEREVMKTGILDYPAEWPKSPSSPLPQPAPEPIQENTAKTISESSIMESPEPANPTPSPDPIPTASPPDITADNLTAIVHDARLTPSELSEKVEEVQAIPEPSYDPKQEALLREQEKERRLFYLFVQELERTGDLRKLPAVLRSPSRS